MMSEPQDAIQDALEALEKVKAQKEAEIASIEHAIAALQGMVSAASPEDKSAGGEYAGLGIIEATKRWLTKVGEPQGTREIADAIRQRGLTTRSKNFTATVYATLANATKVFERVPGDGRWDLKGRKI